MITKCLYEFSYCTFETAGDMKQYISTEKDYIRNRLDVHHFESSLNKLNSALQHFDNNTCAGKGGLLDKFI